MADEQYYVSAKDISNEIKRLYPTLPKLRPSHVGQIAKKVGIRPDDAGESNDYAKLFPTSEFGDPSEPALYSNLGKVCMIATIELAISQGWKPKNDDTFPLTVKCRPDDYERDSWELFQEELKEYLDRKMSDEKQ